MKIIVTDVGSRKSFDVVNILQQVYKYDLLLCSPKDYKFQLRAIYNERVHRLRIDDFKDFSQDFSELLKKFKNEELIYMPLSDKTTKNVYHFIRENSVKKLRLLLPTENDYYLTCDKVRFQEYCEKNDFPVPRSYGAKDIESFYKKFSPLIVKPHIGAGSVGIKHIDTADQLDILRKLELSNYVIQDKILSKEKVSGAFFLCKQGEVVSAYTHLRLRTFPTNGGVTVYSRSTENDEIIKIGSDFLKKMNWNGFAMIEFMFDQLTQEWKIIELNPRLWGSILLSTFSGNDMLQDYVNLCLGLPQTGNKEVKKRFIRWIYPFDFLNLFKGEIKIKEFFRFKIKETGYINFTYSTPIRSFLYIIYFSFNINSISRLFKKIF